MAIDNYPDDIRRFDRDPRSPFFEGPPEVDEDELRDALQTFLLEDDTALMYVISENDMGVEAYSLLIAAIMGADEEVEKFSKLLRPLESVCFEKYGEQLATRLLSEKGGCHG